MKTILFCLVLVLTSVDQVLAEVSLPRVIEYPSKTLTPRWKVTIDPVADLGRPPEGKKYYLQNRVSQLGEDGSLVFAIQVFEYSVSSGNLTGAWNSLYWYHSSGKLVFRDITSVIEQGWNNYYPMQRVVQTSKSKIVFVIQSADGKSFSKTDCRCINGYSTITKKRWDILDPEILPPHMGRGSQISEFPYGPNSTRFYFQRLTAFYATNISDVILIEVFKK